MAEVKKQVRVWADGCFDMMHFGHANSLRQAKTLGDYLIVGVHSDEEITKNKGPPVMTEEERYEAVAACKWVDQVYKNAPYTTELRVLNEEAVRADFSVHGDDLVTDATGRDCYWEVKEAGRFRITARTEGVSTTALVGRMLILTAPESGQPAAEASASPYTGTTALLPSTRRFSQFSSGREPKPGEKIGYVQGGFDLFHIGHIRFLKKAREHCDYLIVGIYDDATVRELKKVNWPVMTLNERALSVLSCRYVDEVILGAPPVVTETIIKHNKIAVVISGSTVDPSYHQRHDEPFKVAKEKGIFLQVESPSALTTSDIVARVMKQRAIYAERNAKKEAKELKEFGKLLHQ